MMDAEQEAPEQVELPAYIIEGARSSRSRCKTCRRKIEQGTLRIGILIEGPYGTGHMWHHLTCAAKRRWDDVEKAYELEAWKEAKEPPSRVPELEKLREQQEKAVAERAARKTVPYVEADPSGRAKCKQCGEPIVKDSLRVVLGREVEFGNQVRVTPVNVHPRCVTTELERPDAAVEAEGLAGALRANTTDVDGAALDRVLAEIGTA